MKDIKKRFESKIKKTKDCWFWTTSKNKDGYGRSYYKGMRLAHRIAWILYKGKIPKGLCVLHKCDNPSCVNPTHLFLGTHQDNMSDMKRKGRVGFSSPLNADKVRKIKLEYRDENVRYIDLAEKYNVSKICIEKILLGTRWSKVTI